MSSRRRIDPNRIMVPIKVSQSDFEKLDQIAQSQNIGRSTLVRAALRRYFESLDNVTVAA